MLTLVSGSLSFTAGMHPISFNRVAVNMMATPNAAAIYDGKYTAELRKTANAMVAKGKGLLACDESTGTVGKRLEANGMENTEANRCAWRNLLFTTAGLGEFISGAILYEETLFQNDPNGKPFVDVLNANGIIPGIKVDVGLKPLVGGGPGETWCTGLDTLAERAPKYYAQGARFAKWRTGLKIDVPNGCPTDLAIEVAAQDLAHIGVPPCIEALQRLSRARQALVLRHWLRQQHATTPSTAQMNALLDQLTACTTRGHRIHLKVGVGFVQRDGQHLSWQAA
jgi:fructose-bisphosphate aldolase class I